MAETWGDPAQSTFRKRFTRLIAVGDMRVRVNHHLAPIVDHALRALDVTDLVVEHVEGHPAYPAGTGLVLRLSPPDPQLVATALGQYGFTPDGDLEDGYRFAGTPEDAIERGSNLDAAYDAEATAATAKTDTQGAPQGDAAAPPATEPQPAAAVPATPAPQAEREAEEWDEGLPGHRECAPGDVGTDVLFLQAYLDAPRTGVYDDALAEAVAAFQSRRGLEVAGRATAQTWQNLTPRTRHYLSPGDGGRNVRILHAALIAAGYSPRDIPVRGIYGVALAAEVRAFQVVAGLAKTGRVRGKEWAALLAPWRASL